MTWTDSRVTGHGLCSRQRSKERVCGDGVTAHAWSVPANPNDAKGKNKAALGFRTAGPHPPSSIKGVNRSRARRARDLYDKLPQGRSRSVACDKPFTMSRASSYRFGDQAIPHWLVTPCWWATCSRSCWRHTRSFFRSCPRPATALYEVRTPFPVVLTGSCPASCCKATVHLRRKVKRLKLGA